LAISDFIRLRKIKVETIIEQTLFSHAERSEASRDLRK